MNSCSWFLERCRFCFSKGKEDSMVEMDEAVTCTISDLFSIEVILSVWSFLNLLINLFITFKLTISPKLSSKICKSCYVKITDAAQFKQEVIEKQNHLNKILLNETSDEYEVEVFENEEYIEEDDEETQPGDKKLKKNESDICICPDCGKLLKGNVIFLL